MSLVKFSSQFPSLFDRFFENDYRNWSNYNYSDTNTSLPSVNIKEDNDGFEVEMAVPGLEREDIKIELNNNVLTISSEKKINNETEDGQQFSRHEFSYQSFCRSFTLPDTIENEKISANYKNGILSVSIPKKEEAKPKPIRQIEIK
jgi:HSP20 family protein